MKFKTPFYSLLIVGLLFSLTNNYYPTPEIECEEIDMIQFSYDPSNEVMHLDWDDPDPSNLNYYVSINGEPEAVKGQHHKRHIGPLISGAELTICVIKMCSDGFSSEACGTTIVVCEPGRIGPNGTQQRSINSNNSNNNNEDECCIVATSGNVNGVQPCPRF